MLALDVSAGATTVCQQRGVGKAFTGTVFELAATAPEPFDTFLMLGNNLGLLGGVQQAPTFLDALATIAAPGARILGETLDPYQTSDPDHLDYHEENRRAGRLAGQLRLRVRHLRLTTPWLDYLFCTPEELTTVVAPSGWQVTDAHLGDVGGGEGGASERRWPPGQWAATLQLLDR